MLGTILVLVITLIVVTLIFLSVLLTVFVLARRNGQQLKTLSLSPTHGVTAEFYNSERNLHNQ